jgi:hypothetical protein
VKSANLTQRFARKVGAIPNSIVDKGALRGLGETGKVRRKR